MKNETFFDYCSGNHCCRGNCFRNEKSKGDRLMDFQLAEIIMTAVVTGITSTVGTVAGIRVHIQYLREQVTEAKQAATRAHQRIDRIKQSAFCDSA